MANFIRTRKVKKCKISDVTELQGFGEAVWNFILAIYKAGWDSIPINKQNISFRSMVASKLIPRSPKVNIGSFSGKYKGKAVKIVKLSPPIPVHPPKEVLEKSKFFGKGKKSTTATSSNSRKSYVQATSSNVSDILKLKENYPNLPVEKIENIHKVINDMDKTKPCIKMTTKELSQKQVIVSISKTNVNKIIVSLLDHVTNINRALKNIKSKVMIDYIQPETTEVTIVSNTVATQSNLKIIESYVKNIEKIISDDI